MIPITMDMYIKNPDPVKKSIANLNMLRDAYYAKYATHRQNHKARYKIKTYRHSDNSVRVHVSVPGKYGDMAYDVIVDISNTSNRLKDCSIKVFSNMPSFVFSSAYLFNMYGWLIPEYKDKLGKKALNDAPDINNPHHVVSYDKSLFFAFNFILSRFDNYDKLYTSTNSKIAMNDSVIKSHDEIMAKYKIAKKKYDTEARRNPAKALHKLVTNEVDNKLNKTKVSIGKMTSNDKAKSDKLNTRMNAKVTTKGNKLGNSRKTNSTFGRISSKFGK